MRNTSTARSRDKRTELLAAAMLNSGQPQNVERLLTAESQKAQEGSTLKLYLGLAYARQGKVKDAIDTLLPLVEKDQSQSQIREIVVSLLHKQAVQSINRKEWDSASESLTFALELAPGNQDLKKLLAAIEDSLPVMYLKAGKRSKAIEVWESHHKNTASGKLAHSLSLAYVFWATELEASKNRADADAAWEKAIAYSVMAQYDFNFWTEWVSQRQSIYSVSGEAVFKLRENWRESFRKRLRGCQEQRQRDLELRYWIEETAACALFDLKKVKCRNCQQWAAGIARPNGALHCDHPGCGKPLAAEKPAHNLTICGPVGLRLRGVESQAKQLIEKSAALPNNKELSAELKERLHGLTLSALSTPAAVLHLLLSEWSTAFALAVSRRFEETLEELQTHLPKRDVSNLKELSNLVGPTREEAVRLVRSGLLTQFVKDQKGVWNHNDWLRLLSRVRAVGYRSLSDEEVGRLLEAERSSGFKGRKETPIKAQEGRLLMLYTCLERGKQLISSVPALPAEPSPAAVDSFIAPNRQALLAFGKGLEYANSDASLGKALVDRIEAVSVGAANELKAASEGFGRKRAFNDELRVFQAAVDVLNSAKQLVPHSQRIISTLAALYIERGRIHTASGNELVHYDRAIAEFESALVLLPNDGSIREQTALAYNNRGCRQNCLDPVGDSTRAIELCPNVALYYANRAIVYLNRNDPDAALLDVEQALNRERKPEWVKLGAAAYNNKGLAIANRQYPRPTKYQLQEAREYFRLAMTLDPSNATYRSNYEAVNRIINQIPY